MIIISADARGVLSFHDAVVGAERVATHSFECLSRSKLHADEEMADRGKETRLRPHARRV
jgi:hypothetical protein